MVFSYLWAVKAICFSLFCGLEELTAEAWYCPLATFWPVWLWKLVRTIPSLFLMDACHVSQTIHRVYGGMGQRLQAACCTEISSAPAQSGGRSLIIRLLLPMHVETSLWQCKVLHEHIINNSLCWRARDEAWDTGMEKSGKLWFASTG